MISAERYVASLFTHLLILTQPDSDQRDWVDMSATGSILFPLENPMKLRANPCLSGPHMDPRGARTAMEFLGKYL